MTTKTTTTLFATLLALGGCATASPSNQLVDARQLMQQAQQGTAGQQTPDELRVAQRTLNRAEEEFEDDPGSIEEQHYAYIADRQIRLAMANADARVAEQNMEESETAYTNALESEVATQDRNLEQTNDALAAVRMQLNETDEEVSEQSQRLRAQEQELMARQQELQAERTARAEAEARYSEAMEQLNEYASIREENNETIITLNGSVLFQSAEATLLPPARDRLAQVAEALKESEGSIVIEGHTDDRGSDAYNRNLSQERAAAVRTYLLSQGLTEGRVTAVGRGEASPIASNDSAEGRANNRRVEIRIAGDARVSSL